MESKIYEELNWLFSHSVRDKMAKDIVMKNLKIEKDGHWYRLHLLGKCESVYCNSSTWRINRTLSKLVWRADVWSIAKEEVKNNYRKLAGEV